MQNEVHTGKIVQMFLYEWADLDKLLKIVERTVLRVSHLIVTVKEIQAWYLSVYSKYMFIFCTE